MTLSELAARLADVEQERIEVEATLVGMIKANSSVLIALISALSIDPATPTSVCLRDLLKDHLRRAAQEDDPESIAYREILKALLQHAESQLHG